MDLYKNVGIDQDGMWSSYVRNHRVRYELGKISVPKFGFLYGIAKSNWYDAYIRDAVYQYEYAAILVVETGPRYNVMMPDPLPHIDEAETRRYWLGKHLDLLGKKEVVFMSSWIRPISVLRIFAKDRRGDPVWINQDELPPLLQHNLLMPSAEL